MKFSSYLNSYRVIPHFSNSLPNSHPMKNLHLFLSLQERRQLCMDARTTFEVGRDVALRAVDDGETVERLAQAMASSHPDPFQPGTVVRFLEEIFFFGGGGTTSHA